MFLTFKIRISTEIVQNLNTIPIGLLSLQYDRQDRQTYILTEKAFSQSS